MARLVIFDIDGTLLDSNDAHAMSWKAALDHAGYAIDFDPIRRGIGMGGDHFLKAIADVDHTSELGKSISKEKDRVFKKEFSDQLRPFPHARELVQAISDRGFQLAVATSSEERDMNEFLRRIEIEDLITIKISAEDVRRTKPDPDLLEVTLSKASCLPRDSMMIGDTPYDIEAAKRAGVQTIALKCGGWNDEELKDAFEIYSDPEDFLKHLDSSPLKRRNE